MTCNTSFGASQGLRGLLLMTVWQYCQIRLNFDWGKVHFQVQSPFVLGVFSSFSYEVICSAISPRNLFPQKLKWRYIFRLIVCPNKFESKVQKQISNPCEKYNFETFCQKKPSWRGSHDFFLSVRWRDWFLTQIRMVFDVVSQWFTMDLKLFQ